MAPRAKIFEEVLASYLAIVSTLRKPFLKGCVLDWREILVQSKSIFGKRVEFFVVVWPTFGLEIFSQLVYL
jgi:hypothetical protein